MSPTCTNMELMRERTSCWVIHLSQRLYKQILTGSPWKFNTEHLPSRKDNRLHVKLRGFQCCLKAPIFLAPFNHINNSLQIRFHRFQADLQVLDTAKMLPLHRAVCASQATIVGGVSTSESISFSGGSASSRLQDEMIKVCLLYMWEYIGIAC